MSARLDAGVGPQGIGGAVDAVDRAIIVATQQGLPLVARPYHEVAVRIGIPPSELMSRMRHMLASGIIRRIAAVPNHYAIGVRANGMSVWDVADDAIAGMGPVIGALAFVSHCYRRPRHMPDWPYNLFAMVHGTTRDEVMRNVGEIAAMLGDACRCHDVLFSSRILKKTGLRLESS